MYTDTHTVTQALTRDQLTDVQLSKGLKEYNLRVAAVSHETGNGLAGQADSR